MCDELDYRAPLVLAGAIREMLGSRGSLEVLDLGCGTGLMAPHLLPLARRLTGVDLSPEMIEHARRTRPYDVLEVNEITRWLTRDSTELFDLIVACDTVIYFGDLSQVVVPAASRLAPGGIVAFTVEEGDHDAPFRLSDSGRYTHTADHVRSVAERAGLRVQRIDTLIPRQEYGEPVAGLLAVLGRP
jgi:predicted TPR repeat methyltransferase